MYYRNLVHTNNVISSMSQVVTYKMS